jgi:ABC-type Zn uptake system ZnuABC Zn-binding protein ZnuA
VVATTPVLADLVGQIAGHRVNIHNLVPADSDVHTWQSTPRDSAHIASADLIISNGARLSPKIADLIKKTVPANTTHVVASAGLVPSELAELDFPGREHDNQDLDDHDHDDDPEHTAGDPHFWLNPRLMVHYVNQITTGLVEADPDHAGIYLDNAAAYIGQLEALDTYIEETLSAIPDQRRVIVTFHDAFGYFGGRYGFDVLAFVGRHGGDVAPDDIVSVLELVQHRGLPAVFAEPQFSADALEQVARDAGIQVSVIRSLPDATYPDYIAMMRANADALAALLR